MSEFQRKATFRLPDGTVIEQVHHGPGDRPATDAEMQFHTSALFKAQPIENRDSFAISVDGFGIVDKAEIDKWTGMP